MIIELTEKEHKILKDILIRAFTVHRDENVRRYGLYYHEYQDMLAKFDVSTRGDKK